jgi:hypothetical protein
LVSAKSARDDRITAGFRLNMLAAIRNAELDFMTELKKLLKWCNFIYRKAITGNAPLRICPLQI